jgi:hypothetical protein
MDVVRQEEQLVRSLLTPFERIEPATLVARRSHRRKRYLICAGIALATIVTGVALGGSLNPFSGIGSADHPRTPNDVLGPAVQAQLRSDVPPSGGVDQIGGRLSSSARYLGTLPSGSRVYVVPTTKGRLCVVVARLAESCGDPLTQAQPVTFITVWDHPGEPTYAYGVARDGVTSVAFTVAGDGRVTVPVQHNLFVYESEPSNSHRSIGDITVRFADGTLVPVG